MESSTVVHDLPNALTELRSRMLRTAIQYTRNPVDAEDLVQTAMERCWQRRSCLRTDSNLTAWMTTVMRNLFIDESRRRTKVPARESDVMNIPAQPGRLPSRWEHLDASHVAEAARACSPELCSTFTMFYFEGMSLERIAERCHISPNTVATRVHRARKKIRAVLEARLAPERDWPV